MLARDIANLSAIRPGHARHRGSFAVLLAGASLSLLASPALAQTQAAATDGAATAASGGLADIVVTAEKREVTIQSAPIAITAVSGDLLKQRNVNELNDISGYVPGLNIAKSGGAERIITIRGIGYETAQNPNTQPGVAFHIDGVYIAHVAALAQDLLDVDRLEVLRGPQGTVFGVTSTGGAINVITKKPVIGEESGTASLSYGSYNYLKANAAVNIPIADTLAMRAAIQYFRRDGYGYSIAVPGRSKYYLDDADNFGGRLALLWQPSSTFSALLEGQIFRADHAGPLQKNILDTTPGARVVAQDFPGKYKIDTSMVYLTLRQELGDFATAKSITAYQYLDKNQSMDIDRLADPNNFDNYPVWQDESKTFTQELSLSSPTGGKFEWTFGGFYLHQRALQKVLETTNPFRALFVLPDGTGVKFQSDAPFQHTSIAGYGQATVRPTDTLSLIAGLRYSWDKISAQPYQLYTVVPPRSATSSALTGKVGVEYKVTPANMLYLTGSRGYKPTGLNFNNGAMVVGTSFKKETVNALEIGSKNEFFDRKFRFNVAGYYYWYNNFQFTAEDPLPYASGTANIPKTEIYGAEFEASVLPFPELRLDGTLSIGKGKFKSNYETIDAQTAGMIRAAEAAKLGCPPGVVGCYYIPSVIQAVRNGFQNVDGKQVPKMPGIQAQVSATYTKDIGSGVITLRGDMLHRGKFNYRLFAIAEFDRVPAYTIYNAFIEYAPHDKPWKLSFSAQNLTNALGINSRFADPYGAGSTSVEYIAPRQVYGTISFAF